MNEAVQLEIVVPEELASPTRLDQFLTAELSHEFAHLNRTRVQKLIAEGQVQVDEKPGKAGLRLHGGEVLQVVVPADVPLDLQAEDIPLDIVFEDEHLAVINKQAGMVTHPGAGVMHGTLVNALLHHCRSTLSGIQGVLRPGIVHRLDKDTSGLLVVAKNDRAHQSLAAQIKSKQARRHYLALLEGDLKLESGEVNEPIGRHPVERKKMAVVESGRQARTHYKVLRHWHKFCLIEALLDTGRTHQIRVHMNSLGAPVVGDIVYNRKTTGTSESRARLGLKGHALHAAYLSFSHPVTGALLEFEAPLPPDIQRLIDQLDEGKLLR